MIDISYLRANPVYSDAETFVKDLISEYQYPSNHPFLEYPNTPEGMVVVNIIMLKMMNVNNNAIKAMVKKCRAIEHGMFNYDKYRQAVNEVLFLYYLLVEMFYNEHTILDIIYEDANIIENEKVPEYSIMFDINNEKILLNVEVKTLSCDILSGERGLDGQELILPYYKDKEFIDELTCKYPNAIVLKDKCCLYQLERNIKKIQQKFCGSCLTKIKMFNVGVIFIDRASSIEQFHAYLFNKKFGLYEKTNMKGIDVLVLMTMDAKVDMMMTNIYQMGYIQSYLVNDNSVLKSLCKKLRLDNYMGFGNKVYESVLKNAEREFEHLKILNRDGYINVIPIQSSEKEIEQYLNFLKGNMPRGL